MPTYTDAELLVLVNSAIGGTLDRNAQQLIIAGRSITALSMSELLVLRNDLEWRIARAAGTLRPLVARFRSPG